MTKKIFFLLIVVCASLAVSFSQVRKGNTHEFKDIYDEQYGINIYDALNKNMGGDSIRNDMRGYALQGWIEDYYPDKQVLHKGYYIDGQLKAYKNYFPSGQIEREFRMTDLSKCAMTVYYPSGKIHSNTVYIEGNIIKEEDYYPSGQLEYVEENDKKEGCYLHRNFYAVSGKPTATLEITDERKKVYSSKEYYDNGNIKEEGNLIYNRAMGDYQKNGRWKFYDENGKLKEEKTYLMGEAE